MDSVREMPPSGIRKFFDIAAEMKDVISLSVGEPDFATPWNVREAAISSIERGHTHYTSNLGAPKLRALICRYLNDRCGLQYSSADQTLVTTGASEALDLAFRTLIGKGDDVLIPDPCYVSYRPGVEVCGGNAVPVRTYQKDGFALTADRLKKSVTPRSKILILPYPNNPTGAIMTEENIKEILPVILQHDLFVVSDEIYSELTYDARHVSPAAVDGLYDRTLVINGFSKSFAMTGFRLGYACGPADVIRGMLKLHQYFMLCAPTVSQFAGEEALSHELSTGFAQIDRMRSDYNRRGKYVYYEFQQMGLPCAMPRGAFYIFPNIASSGMSSEQFCERLVREKKVACVPGTAFGEGGEGYMRCSYASSMDNLKIALNRIAGFLKECSPK